MKQLFIIIIAGTLVLSCKQKNTLKNDAYLLLDSDTPGLIPKVFAQNKISKPERFEQYCSLSPDGKEFYFSITDSAWGKSSIIRIDINHPFKEEVLSLTTSDYQSGQFIDRTNKKMFFTSILFSGGLWHADIYMATRSGNKWRKTIRMDEPVNSYICEWHPTLTDAGVMYFASERKFDHGISDIYKAIPQKGKYTQIEKLPSEINTGYNETDPLIAPDESYLIFASNRPGGISGDDPYNRPNSYDEQDLYISFNKGNNQWTAPVNMGNEINTVEWEFAPALSPDGKYLFFTRREGFRTLVPSKIYWVDAQIIEKFRE